ncbi:MAG: T9SS type A sorting domain-containing protein [Saprospiraceae bacterium]|nr:T9SS type A sorting domain-containing protein [Saprospiraceae bacterium]
MKRMFTLLCMALASSLGLAAQITIDNSIFPEEGDTLQSYLDLDAMGIDLLTPGENLYWDFSMLNADSEQDVHFRSAAEGMASADFPDADLVIELNNGESERYFKITQDYVAEVGFAGLDPVLRQVMVSTVYLSDYRIQIAPLDYGQTFEDSTVLRAQFLYDSLPKEIRDQLGAIRPDSIRVDVKIKRQDEVDAWGRAEIPGGIYDVLRNKSHELRTTTVWAFISFVGWANVTETIKQLIDDPTLLDPVELDFYSYLTTDFKEPVAVVTVDSNGTPQQVQYKRLEATNVQDPFRMASIKLTPNPTYGKAKLYYSGLPKGEYQLVIHDILGNELNREALDLSDNGIEKFDFSYLNRGTYLYSVKTRKGETVTTKRLVLIRP